MSPTPLTSMEENAATDLECDFMRPAEVRRASEDREAAVNMIISWASFPFESSSSSKGNGRFAVGCSAVLAFWR